VEDLLLKMKLDEVKKTINKIEEELRGYIGYIDTDYFVAPVETKVELTKELETYLRAVKEAGEGLDEILYVLEDLI